MSAAVPYAQNAPCCSKHVRMRELAEAEGRVFSKDTVEDAAHYACSPDVSPCQHDTVHVPAPPLSV